VRIGPSQNGLRRAPLPRTGPSTSSLGAFRATIAPRPAPPFVAERPFQRTPLHQREFTYPWVALAERGRSSRALALVRSSNAHPRVSRRPRVGAHSVSLSASPSGVARALARRLAEQFCPTVAHLGLSVEQPPKNALFILGAKETLHASICICIASEAHCLTAVKTYNADVRNLYHKVSTAYNR
jgi:hypothetical protein